MVGTRGSHPASDQFSLIFKMLGFRLRFHFLNVFSNI